MEQARSSDYIETTYIVTDSHLASEISGKTMHNIRAAFRNVRFAFSRSLNPNLNIPFLRTLPILTTSHWPSHLTSHFTAETFRPLSPVCCFSSLSMAGGAHSAPPSSQSLEKQFGDFRLQLEESGSLRERIRAVVTEIESTTRLMYASLLLVHQSRPTPGSKIDAFY